MNFLKEYIRELGGDMSNSFTVCIDSLSHFSSVREIVSFSSERIALRLNKKVVTIEGEGLYLDRLFEGDVIIHGKITGVKIE